MAETKYYGLYQGVVTNTDDPEKRGRIKVKCPDVLGGSTESAWCDPLVPVAYDNGGDFCIPAKDETVWLQFIAGDANRPVWQGGWWQKDMTPLGANYSNIDKVRIISYADCTITMQDGKIDINIGAGSCDLRIEDGKVTIKGNLSVEGSIKANSVSSGSVTAGSISAVSSESGGGTVSAEKVTASSIEATGQIKGSTVIGSTGVIANNISLTSHKHSGVTTGSDNTGSAIA